MSTFTIFLKNKYSFPGGGSFLNVICKFLINDFCVGVVEVTLWFFSWCLKWFSLNLQHQNLQLNFDSFLNFLEIIFQGLRFWTFGYLQNWLFWSDFLLGVSKIQEYCTYVSSKSNWSLINFLGLIYGWRWYKLFIIIRKYDWSVSLNTNNCKFAR